MVPITYTSFSSTYLQLLPAVACVKCLFCLLVPAEKHGDFIELVQHDCGEPFWLQFIACCLSLTFRKNLFRLYIMNMCSLMSNGIYVHTFFSIN